MPIRSAASDHTFEEIEAALLLSETPYAISQRIPVSVRVIQRCKRNLKYFRSVRAPKKERSNKVADSSGG